MRIFTQEIIVAPQHIDIQNRVSNLCSVSYTHLDVYKRQAMMWAPP